MAIKQKFSVEFNTDNAAFEDGNMSGEIARILREAADTIAENGLIETVPGRVKDANGARVGFYVLESYEEGDE